MAYKTVAITAGPSTNLVVTPDDLLTGTGTIDLNSINLTAHGILLGEGAGALVSKVLTNGQLLIGSTGADPVAATLNAGAGVSITNAAGSITISAPQVGTVTSVSSGNTDIGVTNTTSTPVLTLSPTLTFVTSVTAPTTFDLTLGAATATNKIIINNNLQTTKGQIVNRRAVTMTGSIGTTDYIIGVGTLTGVITLTLPAVATAALGQVFVIKDENGLASTFNITLQGATTEFIDSANTFTINSAYESITLYNTGAKWSII